MHRFAPIGIRADQHEDPSSILRAFKSHVTMLGPIISRTEIVPGRAHVARGSITIVAALSREKMQNCRCEHSRGCIKSGVVIYRNSCGHSRTAQRAESSRNICRKLPPRHLVRSRAREQTPRASAAIAITRASQMYFKATTSFGLFQR